MDPLAAGLAVPGAIKATLEVLDRLLGAPKTPPDDLLVSLKQISAGIVDIRSSLITFSEVTVDLRPWKYAHHSTNLVLYREMSVLFTWSKADLVQNFREASQRVQLELNKINHGDSSKSFLQSKSDAELKLALPEGIMSVVGKKTWHRYLIEARAELERLFENADAETFWKLLSDYKDVVKALNHKADSELLAELDRIADRLDEIRSNLKKA